MQKRRSFGNILLIISILAVCGAANGQAQLPPKPQNSNDANQLLRPRIQMGFGTLSYFGDVGNLGGISQRSYLNWGQHITLQNPIGDAFDLNVFALFGRFTSAERLIQSEFNFQTDIRMGGLSVSYNFNHLLPSDRMITPFVSVGITTFDFNPKGNREDSFGRRYHHWSDGSVRSYAENGPQAEIAIPLQMDRSFETDLRQEEGGAQRYPLRALSIPVSAGVDLELSKKFNLRLSSEMHFTNSDYIDGLAGNGAGRNGNDRFMYNSLALSYNLYYDSRPTKTRSAEPGSVPFIDTDEDADGIVDMEDRCPATPAGVDIDELGCPVDTDKDGVPDHLDKEISTAEGFAVNNDGVALTEADFTRMHEVYLGLAFEQNYQKSSTSTADIDKKKVKIGDRSKGYRIQLNNQGRLAADELEKILSIADIKSNRKDGVIQYYAGDYNAMADLYQAMAQIKQLGTPYTIFYNDLGQLTEIDEETFFGEGEIASFSDIYTNDAVVFRVQVGAFSKEVSPQLFKDIPDVLVIPGNDGITRYVSGSYPNIQEAAKHRVNLLLDGYEGAFVTAYKSGKRISLKEAGATETKSTEQKPEERTQINKDFVRFAVQLGVFKGRIPAETLGRYMSLGNVRPIRSDDGSTRYLHGDFDNDTQAAEARKKLSSQGFTDTFVVGEFNGAVISADEARRLRNE